MGVARERERRRVWAITPGGSVQEAEIPRQVLITKVGLKYNVRNRSLGSERESDMAKYSKEQIDAAIDAAMEVFGLESLKHQQREAIREFASGRDVFVALPTGFGKSYCFALLPTVFDRLRAGKDPSIVVCVSPLTALMMEQRDKLCTRGLLAEFVGELQQDISAMKGVESGRYQVVYISPEALLLNPQWREMLLSNTYRENLVAFVIDEAHCITKW